jgi:hypothetical protein
MQYDYEQFLSIFSAHGDALNADLRKCSPIQSYGQAVALVHLLRQEADRLESGVMDTLRIGVINQAKQDAAKPRRRSAGA